MRKYTRALTFEKSWSLLNGGHMESARARASERARERAKERENGLVMDYERPTQNLKRRISRTKP
jgi:hypothetical protein